MLLGGVAAGAIGYGIATWTQRDEAAPVAAVAARLDDQEARLASQADALAALQSAPTEAPAPDGETGPRIDRIEQRLSDLDASVGALPAADAGGELADDLAGRVAELSTAVSDLQLAASTRQDAVAGATADVQAFDGRIADLQQTIDDRVKGLEASLTDRIDALAATQDDQSGTLESLQQTQSSQSDAIAALQETQASQAEGIAAARSDAAKAAETETRRVSAAAAVARISASVESGEPFEDSIGAFRATSDVVVPQVLSDAATIGIPTLQTLADRFPKAARRALDASLRVTVGDGPVNRLGAFLRAQTGARSIAERPGVGADAVLSRAQARLDEGDLDAAVSELAGLPPEGREAMASWLAGARLRLAAADAVSVLDRSTAAD